MNFVSKSGIICMHSVESIFVHEGGNSTSILCLFPMNIYIYLSPD